MLHVKSEMMNPLQVTSAGLTSCENGSLLREFVLQKQSLPGLLYVVMHIFDFRMDTCPQAQDEKAKTRVLGLDRICAPFKTLHGRAKSAETRIAINCQIRCENEHETGDNFAIISRLHLFLVIVHSNFIHSNIYMCVCIPTDTEEYRFIGLWVG